jgi:hypothetical protein
MAEPLPPIPGLMNSPAKHVGGRASGLRSVSRITRWTVVGALALTAAFSAVAAAAFSGRATAVRPVKGRVSDASGGDRPIVALPPAASSGGLGSNFTPPHAAPVAAGGSGQVVSGGS